MLTQHFFSYCTIFFKFLNLFILYSTFYSSHLINIKNKYNSIHLIILFNIIWLYLLINIYIYLYKIFIFNSINQLYRFLIVYLIEIKSCFIIEEMLILSTHHSNYLILLVEYQLGLNRLHLKCNIYLYMISM